MTSISLRNIHHLCTWTLGIPVEAVYHPTRLSLGRSETLEFVTSTLKLNLGSRGCAWPGNRIFGSF